MLISTYVVYCWLRSKNMCQKIDYLTEHDIMLCTPIETQYYRQIKATKGHLETNIHILHVNSEQSF